MVDKRSPSFDASDTGEVPGGPHHLAQPNDTTFYTPNMPSANDTESGPLLPHQQTSYNMPLQRWQATLPDPTADTPVSGHGGVAQYPGLPNLDHHVNLNQTQPQNPRHHIGLGIGYDDNNAVTGQYQEYGGGDYVNMPLAQQVTSQGQGQAQSSPTPVESDHSPQRRTRSGRAIGQSESRVSPQQTSKVTKAPQGKKATKASKREKLKAPTLTAPLSVLTESYTHVQIKDMEAWVNRSAEVRLREVEKRNGHVARPMNSFMLYRSAYADRTKMWCLQNNHQIVSTVSGESWPMETPEIREKYDKLAKRERENHQNAHPGYKFSPSKNSAKKRKTGNSDVEESESSEVVGLDEDWAEKGSRGNRSKSTKKTVKGAVEPVNDSNHHSLRARPFPSGGGPLIPSYPAMNHGGTVPNTMEPHDVYGQFYQTSMYPNLNNQYMEDVAMQRTGTPGSHQSAYPGLVGLPGTFHQDLYAHGSSANTPDEHMVDPMLLGSVNNFSSNPTSGHLGHGNALPYHHPLPATYDTEQGAGSSYDDMNSAYSLNSSLGEQHNNLPAASSQAPEYHGGMQSSLGHGQGHDQWPPRFDAGSEFDEWYEQGS